jgi:hypothetical protein
MGLGHSPSIIPDGLVFYFDPINTRSYAGTGLTGFNLINTAIVGTFTNGPVYDSANKGSINFDGVDDRISFSFNSTLDISQSITIEAYIKPKSYPVGGGGMILTKAASYYLELDSNGKIRVYFYGVSSPGYHESNGTISLNKWTHTVVTRDTSNNTINIYINGVLDKTVTGVTGNITVQQSFSLAMGGYNGSGYLFVGLITCGKIYNRALSAAEILQNYNATKKRFSPEENIVANGLVFNYDAANASSYSGIGNTAYDVSGSGATIALTNGPTFSPLNSGSIVFDGTNDYIEAPHSSILNISGSITVEVWIYMTSLSNSGDMNLICKYSNAGGSSNQSWILFKSTGSYSAFSPNGTAGNNEFVWLATSAGSTGGAFIGTGEQVLANTWYNVVAIYNSFNEKIEIYTNGQLKSSATRTGQTSGVLSTNLRNLQIGGTPLDGTRYVQGRIPVARVFNRALTQQEILQNYNALKSRYGLS